MHMTTTPAEAGRPPAVYAVHDASAAAVTAFCAALQARLPERAVEGPRVDGEDLITEVPAGHLRKIDPQLSFS